MNYRYWKDRSLAEMSDEGVRARQLFYDGTIAYKTSDFEKAVAKFREGLDVWKALLEKHKDYKNDDFNLKDTGLIVKRYVRALRQLGEPEPKEFPFKELLRSAEGDQTVDPFDANEMIGVPGPGDSATGQKRAIAPPMRTPTPPPIRREALVPATPSNEGPPSGGGLTPAKP